MLQSSFIVVVFFSPRAAYSCMEFHVAGLCKPFLMAHIYVDIFFVSWAFCLIYADVKLYQTQKVMSFWKSGNFNAERFPHILKKDFLLYTSYVQGQSTHLW